MPLLRPRWLPTLLGLVALAAVLAHLLANLWPGSVPSLIGSQILVSLLALVHGACTLGPKRMGAFALLVGLGAGLMEILSLKTGLATPYRYTDVLGPRLFGLPVVVPLGWVGLLYLAQWVTNLMLDGDGRRVRGNGVRQVWAALLTAFVLTAYDLVMDPFMVIGAKAWIWEQPSGFLGIPFANYVSWVEVAFLLSLVWRLWDRDLGDLDTDPPGPWLAAVPVLVYAAIGLSDVFVGIPEATRILAPFCMGVAVLAALGRLLWAAEQAEGGEA